MFRWRDGIDDNAVAAVGAGLAELPGKIAEIRSYAFGPDLGYNDTGWHYAVAATFDSVDDWTVYRDHPDHLAFIADRIRPWLAERGAVQFTSDTA